MRRRNVLVTGVLAVVALGGLAIASAQQVDVAAATAEGRRIAAECRNYPNDPRSAYCIDLCNGIGTARPQQVATLVEMCTERLHDISMSAQQMARVAAGQAEAARATAAEVRRLAAECGEHSDAPKSKECVTVCTRSAEAIPSSAAVDAATFVRTCNSAHAAARSEQNAIRSAAMQAEAQARQREQQRQYEARVAASAERDRAERIERMKNNYYIVGPRGLFALEVDSDQNGVIEYRKFVSEASPFLEGRGTLPGDLVGRGTVDTNRLKLRYRDRMIGQKIAAQCGTLYNEGEIDLRPAADASGNVLANMWVTDGRGTCASHNIDLLTCSNFDCREPWSTEHQEVVVMGEQRALEIWESTRKEPHLPETVTWKWIPNASE